MDVATLLMSLLHVYILYQGEDEYTDFFEVTRRVYDQLKRHNNGQNYGRRFSWEAPNNARNIHQLEAKVVILGNPKVGKT